MGMERDMLSGYNTKSVNTADKKVKVYKDKNFVVEVTDTFDDEWTREITADASWCWDVYLSYDEVEDDKLHIKYKNEFVSLEDLKKELGNIQATIDVYNEIQARFINGNE